MRIYRTSAATEVRLDYGRELEEGLKLFPETTPLAADLESLDDSLEAALAARRALRKPLVKARVALRFANYLVDNAIKACGKSAEIADGSRRGPVFKTLFPQGVGPVTAPAGARQIPPTDQLLSRMTKSKNAAVTAFAAEWQPKIEAPLATLKAAGDAHTAALKADGLAFVEELALREEHAHTVDRLMGQVRAAFPRDRAKQDLVFPAVDDGGASASDAADAPADEGADPSADAGSPGGAEPPAKPPTP